MGVPASLRPQDGNGHLGEGIPVRVELLGTFVQEREPGDVW